MSVGEGKTTLPSLIDLNGKYHFVADDTMPPLSSSPKRARIDISDDQGLSSVGPDPVPIFPPEPFQPFQSTHHASSGVRIMPNGKKDELWLEAVHDKISYDRDDAILPITTFESILLGEIGLEANTIDPTTEIGNETDNKIPLHIYDERGRKMTWGMYKKRWAVIHRAIAQDPILNANLLVCEYVQITGEDVKKEVFAYLNEEMQERRIIPLANTIKLNAFKEEGGISNDISKTSQNLAHVVKAVEGFYVMKNRPVGDISKAVHASYAGMLWKIQGYRRLTNRFLAEMQNLEQELKRRKAKSMNIILADPNLLIPLARLLDTMLVYRYTSHITPSDPKEMERVTDAYESMFQSFLADLKTPF